ncbi:MAG TPA: RNA polymerase sigma-54 factor, partial [Bryobacteraceae bacterium]
MSSLSQRLHLGVQQKQILTPGLVQMVTVLQLNRLELKDMIMNEIAENPVLEEAADAGEELTPAELQSLLEREARTDPADAAILENTGQAETSVEADAVAEAASLESGPEGIAEGATALPEQP